MEFFITWAIILGLIVVPGLINYYVNRYYAPPATTTASTLELVAASLTFTFAGVVVDILIVLLASLGWDELKDEVADFVQRGLIGYGRERPIALTGVLSAYAVSLMALMALFGSFRIPSRFVR